MVRGYEPSVAVPSITGGLLPDPPMYAWQPSTWPKAPSQWKSEMIPLLQKIFKESMLDEIDNVIADASGNLQHRGSVVCIALLCALDAISSYGYGARSGKQIPDFVTEHFPDAYKPFGQELLELYRHSMIHSWNLFGAAIVPGSEPIKMENGSLSFGLLDFRAALSIAVADYFDKLATNSTLQTMTLKRYRELRNSARS